jgi:predicted ABC-type transport system involved in lysophospholipase L1 biosynthesis ATPase subunit
MGAGVHFPAPLGGGQQQDIAIDPRDPAQPENNTINRAELSAIWAAIMAEHSRIASDSLGCIYENHKMVHRPQDLDGHWHLTLLTAIRDAIARRLPEAPPVVLLKVPAHVGITGNERAGAGRSRTHRPSEQ